MLGGGGGGGGEGGGEGGGDTEAPLAATIKLKAGKVDRRCDAALRCNFANGAATWLRRRTR
jgi:hypothetical protein